MQAEVHNFEPWLHGRPRTAYDLCERVCEAIEAQPLRYCQEHWALGALDMSDILSAVAGESVEVCGTAFCRAGWMVSIMDGVTNSNISSRAIFLLTGRTEAEWSAIYTVGSQPMDLYWDVDALFSGTAAQRGGLVGSPGYVAEGVAGLRRFMARWETHLRDRVLPDAEVAHV